MYKDPDDLLETEMLSEISSVIDEENNRFMCLLTNGREFEIQEDLVGKSRDLIGHDKVKLVIKQSKIINIITE